MTLAATTEEQGLTPGRTVLVAALIIAAMAAVLFAMGRTPICTCGSVKLWYGGVNTAENSQHLFDWYTPSHVIHGFLFYALFRVSRTITGWPATLASALIASLILEGIWEIAENTPAVIERYRSATIALGYDGDSIVNSVADMVSMMAGFFLASRLPAAASAMLVVGAELFVGWMIRDNFILNVIMLLWPLDGIGAWQAGA